MCVCVFFFNYLFGCFRSQLRHMRFLLLHVGSFVVAYGLSCPTACGILVPQPGIETLCPALKGIFLTHWATRHLDCSNSSLLQQPITTRAPGFPNCPNITRLLEYQSLYFPLTSMVTLPSFLFSSDFFFSPSFVDFFHCPPSHTGITQGLTLSPVLFLLLFSS